MKPPLMTRLDWLLHTPEGRAHLDRCVKRLDRKGVL
jgi:hypothetical protein